MKIEMLGQKFNRLTVVRQHHGKAKDGGLKWVCMCECGKETIVSGSHLRFGQTKSCGCLHREHAVEMGKSGRTHGLTDSGTYTSWVAMKGRCENPKNASYPDYGARGIRVCARWASFENFLSDLGPRPSPAHSIDRIENDRGYEPGNCRWATRIEQANNKRANVRVEIDGVSLSLAEACRQLGVSYTLAQRRIKNGVPSAIALTTPAGLLPRAYTRWEGVRAKKMGIAPA